MLCPLYNALLPNATNAKCVAVKIKCKQEENKHVQTWQGAESPAGIAGFLAINDQRPSGTIPNSTIILQIDAGLGLVTDIA